MTKKEKLVQQIAESLRQEIAALDQAARAAHEAATHEESKAEDQYDTRGLEASYLAGAQMARLESLKKALAYYQLLDVRAFAPDAAIAPGALVELECDGKRLRCFLVAQAGGTSTTLDGQPVQVVTPQSPLGEALLGHKRGDVAEVEAQRAIREYEILAVE